MLHYYELPQDTRLFLVQSFNTLLYTTRNVCVLGNQTLVFSSRRKRCLKKRHLRNIHNLWSTPKRLFLVSVLFCVEYLQFFLFLYNIKCMLNLRFSLGDAQHPLENAPVCVFFYVAVSFSYLFIIFYCRSI